MTLDLSRAHELLEWMLSAPLARTLVLLEERLVMMGIPMMAPSFEEGLVVTDTMTQLPYEPLRALCPISCYLKAG